MFWDTTTTLRQALFNYGLAFTPCLCRASRLIRSGSLNLLKSLLSMHAALSMYRAFYIPRNVWKLFKASMDISFPRFPFKSFWLVYFLPVTYQFLWPWSYWLPVIFWQTLLEKGFLYCVSSSSCQIDGLPSGIFHGITQQVK